MFSSLAPALWVGALWVGLVWWRSPYLTALSRSIIPVSTSTAGSPYVDEAGWLGGNVPLRSGISTGEGSTAGAGSTGDVRSSQGSDGVRGSVRVHAGAQVASGGAVGGPDGRECPGGV